MVVQDIVERLRSVHGPSQCWYCGEYGCFNAANFRIECPCEGDCDCDNVCACNCHAWGATVHAAADEIELLRTTVDESTAALSRTVMALMCKVDDIVRLRADIERLSAEVYRIGSAGDGLAAVAINNAPGVLIMGEDLAEVNDDWDAALGAWDEARGG